MDMPLDFHAGACEAIEVQTIDARGAGKIVLLDKNDQVIKYFEPATTTIFITAKAEVARKGS